MLCGKLQFFLPVAAFGRRSHATLRGVVENSVFKIILETRDFSVVFVPIFGRFRPDFNMRARLLRVQPCMAPYAQFLKEVSYCKYGFRYRKNTDLWTNIPYQPRSLCLKGAYCNDRRLYKYHKQTVQRGPSGVVRLGAGVASTTSLENRYALPAELIEDLFKAATRRARTRWWLPYRGGIDWWRNSMLYTQTDSDSD